ncbi:MAG: hypothetical protein KBT34_04900 [Prevotella sp.]|nr:hypothetical protein [Candidatus Prevotella equi]
MRKIYLLSVFVICSIIVNAQDFIQIDNGKENPIFILNEITSISHEILGEVKVSAENESWNYDISNVNRVSFGLNDSGFFSIPQDALQGWDSGLIFSSGYYFLEKEDKEKELSYYYIGKLYSDKPGLLFYLNRNGEITSISSLNGLINIEKDDMDNSLMYMIDMNGEIISNDEILENANNAKPMLYQIKSAVQGLSILKDWHDRYNTFQSFLHGNWGEGTNGILKDIAGTYVGIVCGPIGGLIVGSCFDTLDKSKKNLEDKGVKLALGSASAEITSVKRTGFKSYEVTVNVSKLETRPYGKVMNKQKDVKVGLFLRESFSTVNRNYYSKTSEFKPVTENGTLTFEVSSLNVGSIYYLVPAIVPCYKTWEYKDNTRYGKTKSFTITKPTAVVKSVKNIKEKSADIVCEFSNIWPEVSCGVRLTIDAFSLDIESAHLYSGSSTNGEQTINATGLSAYTKYGCNAYVKYDNKEEYEGYKGFTTAFPDISGTWTCKEAQYDYAGNIKSYLTYTIDLNSDGTATINKPGFNYINATWSGGATVNINANTISTQNLSQGFVWKGTVVDSKNPTKYKGYTYMWNYNNIGSFQSDGNAIELTR